MPKNLVTTIRVLLTTLLLAALSACGGGGAEVKSEVSTVSPGQQLTDLQKARDSGVITESEYKKMRKKIIDGAS